jgi:preprotein translocase subunit SecD
MNRKIKRIFTNWRVILALTCLLLAIIAIHPNPFVKGVTIRSVTQNSSAALAGIESSKPTTPPMSRERIIEINNKPVNEIKDYYSIVNSLKANITVRIKTTKSSYTLFTKENLEIIYLNETETKVVSEEVYNETTNTTETITKTVVVPKTKTKSLGLQDIGLKVYEAPTTNIQKGLDLQGGTRVLLQPEKKISKDEMDILLENMKYRLNVYGLSDIAVRESQDLSGNQFIMVEIAGVNEEEVKELLAKQGKFEAKIGNDTVFRGGTDITYVCRSADCSGIDPSQPCGTDGSQYYCRFRFSIALTPEAADRQASLTKDLEIVTESQQDFLSEKLVLYLDNAQVDELRIGADLKGRAVTDIEISGSGAGTTQQEAMLTTLKNMKRLQTILITGSLPIQLNIVNINTISPVLGEEFVRSTLLIAVVAILAVGMVIYIRYRRFIINFPIMFTSVSEIIMLLGFAALAGWNIDLASIAGIIIAVGTGVNDQIVISDELLRKEKEQFYDWKERFKRAFFIVISAALTVVAAMLPLYLIGAGLLKGFAITTIVGVGIGVLITRRAFGQVIEILLKE